MSSTNWYEQNAVTVIPAYESLRAENVHNWLLGLLPDRPSLILDIGAGSCRDAYWLAGQGHEVIAIEPAAAMREEGQRLHPDAKIRWIDDRLALQNVHRLGMAFDSILLSAIWMHIPPAERSRAFRKLITLLKPSRLLVITLGHGAAEVDRGIYEVTWEHLVSAAWGIALMMLFLILQGVQIIALGNRRQADVTWHRSMSYLKLGWNWIRFAITHQWKIQVYHFLSDLPDPQPVIASRWQQNSSFKREPNVLRHFPAS